MRQDLLTQLIESGKQHPQILTPKLIVTQAVSLAFAGSDTTAAALSAIFYYLLKTPQSYDKLLAELDAAAADGRILSDPASLITWEQSQSLVYLNAVVKEAMRIHPPVGNILERVTPPEGAKILGTWYPGGTIVGCNAWVIHQRREIFGEDAAAFRPERWIEGNGVDHERIKLMNSYFFAFGVGSRTCLGRHISLLEISKAVPVWLRMFDVSFSFFIFFLARSDRKTEAEKTADCAGRPAERVDHPQHLRHQATRLLRPLLHEAEEAGVACFEEEAALWLTSKLVVLVLEQHAFGEHS